MKTRKNLAALFLLALAVLLLYQSEACAQAGAKALTACIGQIIPSLFPYMVLSSLFLSLDLSALLRRFLPMESMGLSPCSAPVFLTGLLCGFPVGAAGAKRLVASGSISPEEGARLTALSSHVSPAFLLGVTASLWGSRSFGLYLFVFGILFSFLCGLVLRPLRAKNLSCPTAPTSGFATGVAEAFCRAVTDAASACLSVTGFIVFFRVLASLLSGLLPPLAPVFSLVLEFSSGIVCGAGMGGMAGAAFTGFAIGFSGLCVHAQLLSYTSGAGIPFWPVFWIKLTEGLCTATAAALFYIFRPMTPAENAPSSLLTLTKEELIFPLLLLSLLWIFGKILLHRHKFIPKS